MFCAVDRELVGMFVLKYTLHPAITPALQSMVLHRIAPVMVTGTSTSTPTGCGCGAGYPWIS